MRVVLEADRNASRNGPGGIQGTIEVAAVGGRVEAWPQLDRAHLNRPARGRRPRVDVTQRGRNTTEERERDAQFRACRRRAAPARKHFTWLRRHGGRGYAKPAQSLSYISLKKSLRGTGWRVDVVIV